MMYRRFLLITLSAAALLSAPAFAHEGTMEPHSPPAGWNHAGITGTFDKAALQRGFQVYKQVCATCHSMKLLSYRHLTQIGFSAEEVKAIAAEYKVNDGPNDQGEMFERAARPSDTFIKPFPNDQAARAANNGALPPDLSLMAKARHGGENYIYSLLTGYTQPPAEMKIGDGMYYNPYMAGGQIAMPPPLANDDLVTYADGTKATKEQMARDVATFLTWAAEPNLEQRKQAGIAVLIFLFVLAGVLYQVKKKIWSKLH